MPLRALIVDASESGVSRLVEELRRDGRMVSYQWVANADAMREGLVRETWDVVLCDASMSGFGLHAVDRLLKDIGHDIPLIVVSDALDEETAAEAIRAGARDCVLRERLARLVPAIDREISETSARVARREAEAALQKTIDDLRASEVQLRQAQKMEAVGRLAGGIAHDFNNVLSVILSYGELMRAELMPDDPMRDDVDEVIKAGKRAADLTRQLLMFSRQQVLEPRILDLNDVLAGMEKMLRRLLGEGVEMICLPAQRLGKVKVDPSSIEQVIVNLVANARDAMPTGGRLPSKRRTSASIRSASANTGARSPAPTWCSPSATRESA